MSEATAAHGVASDAVRAATERFFAQLDLRDGDRRLPRGRIDVVLAGSDGATIAFAVSFSPAVEILADASLHDGARLELTAEDWRALLEGATTGTELWFAGRLKARAWDTWRSEYARFLNLIRVGQGRPVL